MDKPRVIAALEEVAALLDLQGESPFKVRAYENAARVLQDEPRDLGDLVDSGDLARLKGFGEALTDKVQTLYLTGGLPFLDELRAQVPPGLPELLRVPRLGPKKVRALWKELDVDSLDALARACHDGRVAGLKGFGAKTQASILQGLEHLKAHEGRFLADHARHEAEALVEALRGLPGVTAADVAGGLRRWKETVHDVDLVAASEDPGTVMDAFAALDRVEEVLERGPAKARVRLARGLVAELRVGTPDEYPYLLLHLTGSKEHNVRMRARAQARGLTLSEHGLFRGETRLPAAGEVDIFAALDLDWIAPELREDRGELEAAARDGCSERGLPRLVEFSDLRGVIHCHSDWSDGRDTLEAMARGAHARGYGYLVICDHSHAAAYAGGLTVQRVRAQHRAVDELNERLAGELDGFRVLKGIESDILVDGSLDYDEDVLASFQVVVGSVHSGFHLDQAAQTARVLRALESPWLDILGHPTGRLLLEREGLKLDMAAVVDAAAARGVVLEVNANPRRLDLDWRWIPRALSAGALLAVDPDAHSVKGLDHVRYGLGTARKGGAGPERVVNCLEAGALLATLAQGRARRAR